MALYHAQPSVGMNGALVNTILPQTVLRQLMNTKMVSISFPQFI
ncbi:hypothetical protein D047_4737 [Vibrio parahaemolyticus VPTS-2010_2]|nr:hypothetical protein D047_4737 [Vibrio parahaemolyticus VPTS-2010_2]